MHIHPERLAHWGWDHCVLIYMGNGVNDICMHAWNEEEL